jgi:glycosyltransferase involved in cell wall biosynthesis
MTTPVQREHLRILYHHRIRSKDGQFVHIEEMVSALRAEGHEVLISGPPDVSDDELGSSGKLVPWLKRYVPKALYELMELAYAVTDYARLSRDVRRFRPDVIYERYNLFMPSGIWAKRRFRLPLILEVNAPLHLERKQHGGLYLERMARWTERYCWTNADVVLPVTRVLGDYLREAGVSDSRICVIPNAINLERFSRAISQEDSRRRLKLKGDLVLGFVGFVRDWHGLGQVIDLLANPEFRNVSLVIVGDGPARSTLERDALRRGVESRVVFTGVASRDDVPHYIAAFDIALQPRVVPYASPLKIYEYMVMGKPIVAPASPNIQEVLVHQETALLFDQARDGALEEALKRLVRDRELRYRIGTAAREALIREEVSWPQNARKVAALGRVLRSTGPQLSRNGAAG